MKFSTYCHCQYHILLGYKSIIVIILKARNSVIWKETYAYLTGFWKIHKLQLKQAARRKENSVLCHIAALIKILAFNTPENWTISSSIHSPDSIRTVMKSLAYQQISCRFRDVLDQIRWNLNGLHGEIGSLQQQIWAQIRNEANIENFW